VPVNTSIGRPSELCWMTITPDARLVFATLTGYGYITRWRLDGDVSSIAKDPACPNFREMAPSGGSAASSAPTERHVAVAKRRLSVPELRERLETGGATPSSRMVRSTRSPARVFRTTAHRARGDS